jgi:replicative DNA helicase
LIRLSNELMSRCYEGSERPSEILESAESQIFSIASREIQGGFEAASSLAPAAYSEIEETSRNRGPVSGINTGFTDLNRMTGGFHKHNLVVVAARPGLGKTSFCLNIACHAAIRAGKSVGILRLEISKPETVFMLRVALAAVALLALSAWPVAHYGEMAFDRVLSMSDDPGGQYLKYHEELADRWIFLFYTAGAAAVAALIIAFNRHRYLRPAAVLVALLAAACLIAGAVIGDYGGKIRHREFRNGPPPVIDHASDDSAG